MKKQLILLAAVSITLPLFAQQSNITERTTLEGERRPPMMKKRDGEMRKRWEERNGENLKEFQERKLKLLDRALDKINVSQEDREKISALQQEHSKKMKANHDRMSRARRALSELERGDATDEEIDAAIAEVADAQAEQLKILVGNRRAMERILGKEKNAQLMEAARSQFRKHGRRGGPEMPRRPGIEDGPEKPQKP